MEGLLPSMAPNKALSFYEKISTYPNVDNGRGSGDERRPCNLYRYGG